MHEISWHRSGTGGNWFEHLGFSLRFEREKRLALWKAGFFYRTFNPWVVGSIPTGPTFQYRDVLKNLSYSKLSAVEVFIQLLVRFITNW